MQKELAEREKELVQKENLIANLTQQLEKFNNSLSDNNSSDAFTELKEAKEKAEKERSSCSATGSGWTAVSGAGQSKEGGIR